MLPLQPINLSKMRGTIEARALCFVANFGLAIRRVDYLSWKVWIATTKVLKHFKQRLLPYNIKDESGAEHHNAHSQR